MRTRLGRRLGAVIGAMALAGGLAGLAGPGIALAADDCAALGGAIVAGECQVPAGLHPATGAFNLDETLHLLANAHIDATSAPATGISLTIDGDLVMDAGSIIEADDPCCFPNLNVGAGTVTIDVTGDVLLKSTSRISANNDQASGPGGNITITVDGDMTMCGPAGAQAGCGGPDGSPGALISAQNGGTNAGDVGGDITITVGDLSTATGVFFMEGGSTGYGTETGATIDATAGVHSGDITITAGESYFSEPGSVVQSGGHDGHATQQGGKIYIVAGCELTTEGRITSKGPDPGADLVHLEGCAVLVRGLVESTGKGHTVDADTTPPEDKAPFNSCDGFSDSLTNEVVHADKPFNATGCIEVWGKVITIDATQGWAGELNADIGDGGTAGESWIDIYALSKLDVIDVTGNDQLRNNLSATTYLSTYAVHANTIDGSDGTPNTITAKVKDGTLTASGKAFESSATLTGGVGVGEFASDTGHAPGPYFVGNGSTGGTITLEASGNVTLNTAWVNASGDFYGITPPCDDGSGTCGSGGHIVVSAWATGSDLSWQAGSGDVRPNLGGPNGATGTSTPGDINLNACDTLTTTGTDFHGATVPPNPHTCSATEPTLPSYVITAFANDAAIWAICGSSSVAGTKFDDQDANGVKNDGEPGLDGWTIHLFGTDTNSNPVHLTETTAGGGNYLFTAVPPGSYTVCEELPAATPPWQQTFPNPGTDGTACEGHTHGATITPGPYGYAIDLTGGSCCTGQEITDQDFGNIQLATKTGIKWDDQANDRTPPFEATIDGWKIHLYGTAVNGSAVHRVATTAGGGVYSFTVLPGSYTVCEELQSNWGQTYPTSGADCVTPGDPNTDNPNPGPVGYAITLTEGETERGNDFANHQTPVEDNPPCEKLPVQNVLDPTAGHQYVGNLGPDYFVRVNHGDLVQDAVNAAALAGGDTNGDGYLIIMVSAHDDGSLGGSSTQNVVISAAYTKPFALIGCSVTLKDANLQDANGTIKIASSASSTLWNISEGALAKSNIFLMDLHGSGSNVAGVEVWGNQRYLRNEGGSGNSGVGFKITGNSNTMHNGAANANSGDGVYVSGSSNLLTDTNAMSNAGNGFNVVGNSNKLVKLDSGERGTGNGGDGIHVVGNTNTLTENDAFANLGDGIDVAGNGNILSKNVAGDRGKGNGFAAVAGNGFLILGLSNNLTENKASANQGDGFSITGTSTQTSSTANLIKNNLSNTGAAGSDLENLGKEWRFFYWIKNNGGGNKADGTTLASGVKTLTNFPASGSTFNYGAAGQAAE